MRQLSTMGRCAIAISLGLGLLIGCQGRATVAPEATPAISAAGPAYALVSGEESLVAMYELVVDLAAGTATSTPIPPRSGSAQPPQAQQYDLDIANFLTPQGFTIEGITVLPSGDVRVSFQHAHPFPGPNPANPITGLNRADLGYTGRALLLATGSPQSFFDGTVTVSPNTVLDADGYLNPGDLIQGLGLSPVNVFPYKLLADEAKNNRVNVSNNDLPTGTYDSASGGWQLANLGTPAIGWTGYDYVHGGQIIANDFTLSKESLGGGFFRADVAILIKYTDPRGQGGASRRLPPTPADPLAFAYRLPYAALDMSVIENEVSPLEMGEAAGSQVGARFFVRDWDATAEEASDAPLGDESDVALIQPGAAGKGTLTLDCPALAATPVSSGGSPGTPSGHPGDELVYRPTLTNELGTASGLVYALARIVDPEFNDPDRADYAFGVDPVSLIPSAARAVDPITYQVLPVIVGEPPAEGPPEITEITPDGVLGATNTKVTFSAVATGSPFLYAWNFGTGVTPSTYFGNNFEVTLAEPGLHTGTVVAVNSFGSSGPAEFTYSVYGPPNFDFAYTEPAIVTPGLEVTFHAVFDPPAEAVDWVFPVGFSLTSSNDASPTLNAPLTPGQHFVTLYAANPAGPASPSEILVIVERAPTAGWTKAVLQPTVNTGTGPAIVMGDDGFPVIAYVTNAASSQVRVARALNATPSNPGDWTDHAVAAVTGETIMTPKLTLRGDRLLLAYVTDTRLRFANATTNNPLSGSDWEKSTILSHTGTFELLELQEIAGAVQWLAWDIPLPFEGVMRFGRALVVDPNEESDWHHHTFAIDIPQFIRPVMCVNAGLQAVVIADQSLGKMRFGKPLFVPPMEESDWEFTDISSQPYQSLSLRPYQGGLVLGYANPNDQYRPYVARTATTTPATTTDWTHHRVSTSINGVTRTGISMDGSRLLIAAQDGLVGDLTLSYASLPDEESDWTTAWIATYGYQGSSFAVPPDADGTYIVYPDSETSELILGYQTP